MKYRHVNTGEVMTIIREYDDIVTCKLDVPRTKTEFAFPREYIICNRKNLIPLETKKS